jgi:hypothetical protein
MGSSRPDSIFSFRKQIFCRVSPSILEGTPKAGRLVGMKLEMQEAPGADGPAPDDNEGQSI